MLMSLEQELAYREATENTAGRLSKEDTDQIKRNLSIKLDVVEFIRRLRSHRASLPAMNALMANLYEDLSQDAREKMRAEAQEMGLIQPTDAEDMIRETVKNQDPLSLLTLGLGAPTEYKTRDDATRLYRALDSAGLMGGWGLALARAAMGFGDQYVVTRMHPSATRTVRETDLAFWPSSCPKPLTRPMLVQADRTKGDGYLFHTFHTLLWVPFSDGAQGLCLQGDEGIVDTMTKLSWSADNPMAVKHVLQADIGKMLTPEGAIRFEVILQWLVKLALFFEAESTSGKRMTTCDPRIATLPNGRPAPKGQSFTVRYLRISDEALTKPQREASADHPPPPHADNLVSREVLVRGFLRRQVCGKGGKERKVIYIAPHVSHRYVSPEKEVRVL